MDKVREKLLTQSTIYIQNSSQKPELDVEIHQNCVMELIVFLGFFEYKHHSINKVDTKVIEYNLTKLIFKYLVDQTYDFNKLDVYQIFVLVVTPHPKPETVKSYFLNPSYEQDWRNLTFRLGVSPLLVDGFISFNGHDNREYKKVLLDRGIEIDNNFLESLNHGLYEHEVFKNGVNKQGLNTTKDPFDVFVEMDGN